MVENLASGEQQHVRRNVNERALSSSNAIKLYACMLCYIHNTLKYFFLIVLIPQVRNCVNSHENESKTIACICVCGFSDSAFPGIPGFHFCAVNPRLLGWILVLTVMMGVIEPLSGFMTCFLCRDRHRRDIAAEKEAPQSQAVM